MLKIETAHYIFYYNENSKAEQNKLEYYLCNSPEEVGMFHEDAHLISYVINRPESVAIREGLAMYFDKTWWKISNQEWVSRFLKTGQYIPVAQLLDEERFYAEDCAVTYPIMGAFTEWLIKSFGIEKYLQFYQYVDVKVGMVEVYQ